MSRVIVSPLYAPEKKYNGTTHVTIEKYKNMGYKSGGKERCLYVMFPDYKDFAIQGQSIHCMLLGKETLCIVRQCLATTLKVVTEDLENYNPMPHEYTIQWTDIISVQVAQTAYKIEYV